MDGSVPGSAPNPDPCAPGKPLRPPPHGSLISTRRLPLFFDRGEPRGFLKWVRIFLHAWRYGWRHPDEDLLGVIDAAGDSLRSQIIAARAVVAPEQIADAEQIHQQLEDELAECVPELAILLGLESRINALYPPALQRRRAWMIRERFERVAPGRAAIEYWFSYPDDSNARAAFEEQLRSSDEQLSVAHRRAEDLAEAVRTATEAATAASARYDSLRSQLSETDEDIAAHLTALDRSADGESAPPEPKWLDLRDAAAAKEAADANLSRAQVDKSVCAKAVETAQVRRDLAVARLDLSGKQNAVAEAERAFQASEGTTVATDAQAKLNLARAARDAARQLVDDKQRALTALGGTATAAPGGPAQIDADAQTLLDYIHSSYLMSVSREKAVRDLMRWLMLRFWSTNVVMFVSLMLLWGALAWIGVENLGYLAFGLFFVAAVGRIGATMSVVQRLQGAVAGNVLSRDPITELTRLRTGKTGINIALFSGAVFALLLYAMFSTGIAAMIGFERGIFPTPAATPDAAAEDRLRNQIAGSDVAVAARSVSQREEELRFAQEALAQTSAAGRPAAPAPSEPSGQTPPQPTALPPAQPSTGGAAGTNGPPAAPQGVPAEGAAARVAAATAALADARATLNVTLGRYAGDPSQPPAQVVALQDPGTPPARQSARQPASRKPAPPPGGQADARTDRASGTACRAKDDCDPFTKLAEVLGFADREDFFKLLLWAFLAGFAERLVPDMLDSLSRRARRSAEADATIARPRPAAPPPANSSG